MNIYEAQQLKQLEREYDTPAPKVEQSGEWATGTPVQKGQTRRHPGTGQPLTEQEHRALLEALRRRATPRE